MGLTPAEIELVNLFSHELDSNADEKLARMKHLIVIENANINQLYSRNNYDSYKYPLFWELKYRPKFIFQLADAQLINFNMKDTKGYSILESILNEAAQTSDLMHPAAKELIEYLCKNLPLESFTDESPVLKNFSAIHYLIYIKPSYHLLDLLLARGIKLPLPKITLDLYKNIDDYIDSICKTADFYLAYQADPSIIYLRGKDNKSIIFYLLSETDHSHGQRNLSYLLQKHPNMLFDKDDNNSTALHFAALKCNDIDIKVFETIIIPALYQVENPNVSLLDYFGYTALHYLIIQNANIDLLDDFLSASIGYKIKFVENILQLPTDILQEKTAYFYYNNEIEPPSWFCRIMNPTMIDLDLSEYIQAINVLEPLQTMRNYDREPYIKEIAHVLFEVLENYVTLNSSGINTLSESGATALFFALKNQNIQAAKTLLDYGANPTIYGDIKNNPIFIIDLLLQYEEISEYIQQGLRILRKLATIDYAEKQFNYGDFDTVINICSQIKSNNPNYAKAQELMGFALVMKGLDDETISNHQEKMRILALPYYIRSVQNGGTQLQGMRDQALRNIYHLPEDATPETLDEKAMQFMQEMMAASKIQKSWSKYQGKYTNSPHENPTFIELFHKLDYRNIAHVIIENITPKQKELLSKHLQSIILYAIQENFHELEQSAIDKDLEIHTLDAVNTLRELSQLGSDYASFKLLCFMNEIKQAEKLEMALRLANSKQCAYQLEAIHFLDRYNIYVDVELTADLSTLIISEIFKKINDERVSEVQWLIERFKPDLNQLYQIPTFKNIKHSIMEYAASANNNPQLLEVLVRNGADLNLQHKNRSPLSEAVISGKLLNVIKLIELGANANIDAPGAYDINKKSIIARSLEQWLTAYKSSIKDRFLITQALVQAGARVTAADLEYTKKIQREAARYPESYLKDLDGGINCYVNLIETALQSQENKRNLFLFNESKQDRGQEDPENDAGPNLTK